MTIATVENCGQGLNTDLSPEELGLGVWSSVENVRFNNGYAERFKGMLQVFATPAVTPYWIAAYATTTTKFIVHAGLAAVYVDDGTTRTDITGTAPTGAIDDRWTGGTLNGVLVMNNGKDVPVFWGGNTALNLATLTNWDANERAESIRPFKNFLVALNITKTATKYPHLVKWSHSADPGTIPTSWDETDVTLDAGEQDLSGSDLLVDSLPLGDALILYKERSCWAMTHVGAPYIFRFQRLPGEHGMLARGCAVDTPVGHIVMSAGDIVVNTGSGTQSIANGAIRRYIFSNINQTYYKRSFVTSNPAKNEVWVCFPFDNATSCDRAAVWNWVDKTWTVRTLTSATYGCIGTASIADTWDADSGVWDSDSTTWNESDYSPAESRLFMCHSTPLISLVDGGSTDFGSIIDATLERTGMTLGDPQRVKTIKGIRPRIDGDTGAEITIEIGASMVPDGTPTWSAAQTFTIGTDIKIDSFATGRFMSVRFSNSDYSQWRIRSFDIDYVTQGMF
jgi:hypothetical protein